MGNLTVKESGEMVNFISPNVSKITSFKVYFSPRQEGTGDPSPENVREITGWNGVEGYGSGKNLFNGIMRKGRYNTTTGEFENANWYTSELLPVKPNTSYAFVEDGELNTPPYSYQFDEQKQYISGTSTSSLKIITTRNETKYIAITISARGFNENYLDNFMICEGDNINAIRDITASIDWTNDVGTIYGGYVDLISGELVETHNKITFDGSNDELITHSSNFSDWIQLSGIPNMKTGKFFSDNSSISNRAKKVSSSSNKNELQILIGANNSKVYIYNVARLDSTVTTDETLRNWFLNNPITFTYPLAEPITHQLTPQQLSTLKGQNNFWSNADYIEIEYELTETFDIQKAKRKIILNQPHVESASGDLVTFDTDMKGKLKECKVYFSPVQEGEGDPSPDNVRNIVGWNGVNIYKAGQNLIPNDIPTQFYRVYPSGGHFIESGTAFSTFIIPIPKGKICLARTTRSLLSYGALCDEPPTVGGNAFNVVTMTNRYDRVFDNSEGYKYFAITIGRSVEVNSDWASFLDTEPRLTISDTVQPYTAPTNMSIYSIDWTDSVGTVYGGYVDLISGELVQTWYEFILDGINNYLNSGSQLLNNGLATIYDYIGSGGLNNLPKGPVNTYTGAIICNKFPLAYNRENEGITTGSGSLYIRLLLDPSKLEDVSSTSAIKESMIKWQQENPLQIVYKLGTPIHYQLTPQQILTFKEINNVYSDTNGQMEIKYWKH